MEYATLNSETLEMIRKAEQDIKERSGKEIVLIAYNGEE